jgi:hypothetical protein
MIDMQPHVTSLETSRKLYEAGMRHKGAVTFYWRTDSKKGWYVEFNDQGSDFDKLRSLLVDCGVDAVPAFLLSEVMELKESRAVSLSHQSTNYFLAEEDVYIDRSCCGRNGAEAVARLILMPKRTL